MSSGPAQINLTVDGSEGRISPPVVDILTGSLVVNNGSGVKATVVLPAGVSPRGAVFHCQPGATITIEILKPSVARENELYNYEIPYWVFFHGEQEGRGVRCWGVAASPPSMVIGP
mgnify:CR=1 FL=1